MLYTKQDILNRLSESQWNTISLVVKTGHTLDIVPCSMTPITNETTVEFFIIDGPIPWMCAHNIEELLPQLNEFDKYWAEYTAEKEKLKTYYLQYIKDKNYTRDEWGFYSDWHKDVFGRRPIGQTFG